MNQSSHSENKQSYIGRYSSTSIDENNHSINNAAALSLQSFVDDIPFEFNPKYRTIIVPNIDIPEYDTTKIRDILNKSIDFSLENKVLLEALEDLQRKKKEIEADTLRQQSGSPSTTVTTNCQTANSKAVRSNTLTENISFSVPLSFPPPPPSPLTTHLPNSHPPVRLPVPLSSYPVTPIHPTSLASPAAPSLPPGPLPAVPLQQPPGLPPPPPVSLQKPSVLPPVSLQKPSILPPVSLQQPQTLPPVSFHKPQILPPVCLQQPPAPPPIKSSVSPPYCLPSMRDIYWPTANQQQYIVPVNGISTLPSNTLNLPTPIHSTNSSPNSVKQNNQSFNNCDSTIDKDLAATFDGALGSDDPFHDAELKSLNDVAELKHLYSAIGAANTVRR